MVGQVVGLQLAVVGVLDVDGLVADVRRGGGVVVHHGDRCFLRSHFYKSLEEKKGAGFSFQTKLLKSILAFNVSSLFYHKKHERPKC